MANSDFFLEFGSNARTFSSELEGELGPSIAVVEALTRALKEYDETSSRSRGSSSTTPGTGNAAELDRAASRLTSVATEIGRSFQTIIRSVEALVKPLQEAQRAAVSAPPASVAASRTATATATATAAAATGSPISTAHVNPELTQVTAQLKETTASMERAAQAQTRALERAETSRSNSVASVRAPRGPATQSDRLADIYIGLREDTRKVIDAAQAAVRKGVVDQETVNKAARALTADPAFLATRARTDLRPRDIALTEQTDLRDLLGLNQTGLSRRQAANALAPANVGSRGYDGTVATSDARKAGASGVAEADNAAASAAERMAAVDAQLGSVSRNVAIALAAEIEATERLSRVTATGKATTEQYTAAKRALLQAEQRVINARASEAKAAAQGAGGGSGIGSGGGEEPPPPPGGFANDQRFFGSRGLKGGLQRHLGSALENTIAYTLIFSGFEKLKELEKTGLLVQEHFVRLQASLDANGISAVGLQTKLQGISSSTATPIEHVVEAASELAGVFQNAGDLTFGTKIASQLANISQGTLSAKEAAVGLRDVLDAYGDTSQRAVQAVGDQIARLSQLTGVSVKDITKGTTEIAQEASHFGLGQSQASTLAAYVTRGTGETGEQSASQLSRLLSTITSGQAQQQLISAGVATSKQFQSGDIAGVLTNLITKYKQLAPAQQQAISGLVGTGITARAFTSVVNIGTDGLKQFNGQLDVTGALAQQNGRILATVQGKIRQLDEDFQSLGANLVRLGAFDVIGGMAQSFDLLLKAINATFGRIADIAGSSPLTKWALTAAIAVGELALAFKLLNATGIVGGLGRVLPGVSAFRPTNAAAIAAREVENAGLSVGSRLPAIDPAYRQLSVRGGLRSVGGIPAGLVSGGRETERLRQALDPEGAGYSNRVTTAGRNLGAAAAAEESNLGRLAPVAARVAPGIERVGLGLTGLSSAATNAEQGIRKAVGGIGGFNLALLGVTAGIALISAAYQAQAEQDAATGRLKQAALGTTPPPDKPEDANVNAAQTAVEKARDRSGFRNGLEGFLQVKPGGESVFNSGGPSGKSQEDYLTLVRDENKKLRAAYATKDPAKIIQAENDINADIEARSKKIAEAGGNNSNNQAEIYNSIVTLKNSLQTSGDARIKTLQGFAGIDQLNQQQEIAITQMVQQAAALNQGSITADPQAVKGLLDQSGLAIGSNSYNQAARGLGLNIDRNGNASFDSGSTTASRLQGNIDVLNTDISQQTIDLNDPGKRRQLGGPKGADYLALQQSRDSNISQRQQLVQQQQQNAVQVPIAAAGINETTGNFSAAVTNLQQSSSAAQRVLQTVDSTDPAYYTALKQLQDNKQKIADLLSENANAGLVVAAAGLSDPLARARNQAQQAANILANTPVVRAPALSDAQLSNPNRPVILTPARRDALAAKAAADLSTAQAVEAQRAAQQSAAIAPVRDVTAAAQLQLNETLRQENIYASGALKNDTKLAELKGTEAQNRIAIADATQADTQSFFEVTAAQQSLQGNDLGAAQTALNKATQAYANAISQGQSASVVNAAQAAIFQAQAQIQQQILARSNSYFDVITAQENLQGNAVGAARDTLSKARSAYNLAVQQTGSDSNLSRNAYAQVLSAQAQLNAAILAQTNSALDLQIAQLNARGGLGDAQRAAADQTQKARNAIAAYRKAGGKPGTQTANQLQADLVTAQRNQFDVALNAQLDTLDFQKSTYQITGAQEIQALQQILRNKQLTLAEQRSITLKIRGLQDSIRAELTNGGLNIPSDIKLPTAYQVRRSLGAGFGGAGTNVVTNNNQRATVTVNQTLPTAALAHAVANSVISILNAQTGQQVRANSATPRLVRV